MIEDQMEVLENKIIQLERITERSPEEEKELQRLNKELDGLITLDENLLMLGM